jgi:antirestriction protein ArdC
MRVEEIITDRIVRLLQEGVAPRHRPWSVRGVAPANAISQRPYSGINVLMLASQAYGSPYWLTFKQAIEAKGSVGKGERGSVVVFAKRNTKEVETDAGVENKTYTVLRYYVVLIFSRPKAANSPSRSHRSWRSTRRLNAVSRFTVTIQINPRCATIPQPASLKLTIHRVTTT